MPEIGCSSGVAAGTAAALDAPIAFFILKKTLLSRRRSTETAHSRLAGPLRPLQAGSLLAGPLWRWKTDTPPAVLAACIAAAAPQLAQRSKMAAQQRGRMQLAPPQSMQHAAVLRQRFQAVDCDMDSKAM